MSVPSSDTSSSSDSSSISKPNSDSNPVLDPHLHVHNNESKRSKYPKIDVHTHILPETFPDLKARYGYGDWVRLDHNSQCTARMFKGQDFFREIQENCYRVYTQYTTTQESLVFVCDSDNFCTNK